MYIEIVEENCGIFRCGVFRDTGAQLPPHASEEECIRSLPMLWGCSKPFRLVGDHAEPCGYI